MLWIGLWIVCGFVAGSINNQRGHNALSGFLVGLVLGPIGVLLALATSKNTKGLEKRLLNSDDWKKCPACAELVRGEAQVCRFCQHSFLVHTKPGPDDWRTQLPSKPVQAPPATALQQRLGELEIAPVEQKHMN